MRQVHRAGEKLFVDYCGATVPVVDAGTGEVREAQIFVAVWGASNSTYAEATWSQGLSDWTGSHVRAFEFGGVVTEEVVPDNLKSGISRPCRYEPELNPTYHDLAVHYGVAVMPARVRKPRDKAKVEVGVQVVERWILARLRHRKFFSLAELNEAIGGLLVRLNERPFRKLEGSRRSVFESLERPALRSLPLQRFAYAEWKKGRVHMDYHVEVEGHSYSVPYQLVSQQLDVRVSAKTVEFFAKGHRVASHLRSFRRGVHTTQSEHMPRAHREYAEWTPERLGGCTRSMVFVPAWGSCAWGRSTAASVWKRHASTPSKLTVPRTAACARSWREGWIGRWTRPPSQRRTRGCMRTSEALPTTAAGRRSHADPSDAGEAPGAQADRHGQGP